MIRSVVGTLIVGVSIIAGATSAGAQLAPTYSGQSDAPVTASEQEYWDFVANFGSCLVRTKRIKAIALVQSPIGSSAEKLAFDALINRNGANSCMRNMVRATLVLAQVRGAIAEGLYKAQFAASPLPPARTRPETAEPARSIHELADCMVAERRDAAHDLLVTTRLGTREERDRVTAMGPTLGVCLPAGRKIKIVAVDIRLAIASALYRASLPPVDLVQGRR